MSNTLQAEIEALEEDSVLALGSVP